MTAAGLALSEVAREHRLSFSFMEDGLVRIVRSGRQPLIGRKLRSGFLPELLQGGYAGPVEDDEITYDEPEIVDDEPVDEHPVQDDSLDEVSSDAAALEDGEEVIEPLQDDSSDTVSAATNTVTGFLPARRTVALAEPKKSLKDVAREAEERTKDRPLTRNEHVQSQIREFLAARRLDEYAVVTCKNPQCPADVARCFYGNSGMEFSQPQFREVIMRRYPETTEVEVGNLYKVCWVADAIANVFDYNSSQISWNQLRALYYKVLPSREQKWESRQWPDIPVNRDNIDLFKTKGEFDPNKRVRLFDAVLALVRPTSVNNVYLHVFTSYINDTRYLDPAERDRLSKDTGLHDDDRYLLDDDS